MAALYEAYYRSLVAIAALLSGDGTRAEEIVQDAYVSAHRAWRNLRDGDEALSYLRLAVVSTARFQGAASSDPLGRPRDVAGAGPRVPSVPGPFLVAALRGFPARQREALVLRYYADWPDAQIAAVMGISRHALNAHIQRGMSTLRALAAAWAARALTAHACCLLQPLYCREYFPVLISPDKDLPPFQPGKHAVVTIALADGEAETFFARPQEKSE